MSALAFAGPLYICTEAVVQSILRTFPHCSVAALLEPSSLPFERPADRRQEQCVEQINSREADGSSSVPSRHMLVMPTPPDSLRRVPPSRRGSAERSQIRERVSFSPPGALRDHLAASLEHYSGSTDSRWSVRSSDFLVLGVGSIFWGTLYLLFFA
jgi:hypothetical protein